MNILAIVLAGGEGTRLYPLTAQYPKPAVPFVDGYRIVDFVLSNLVNSQIAPIYLLAQYKPEPLIGHIEKTWAGWSAGPGRAIRVILPSGGTNGEGCFRGTADAVHQNVDLIRRHRPDVVAVFAADHIYRMDVRQMVRFHCERRADVTVAAVPVPVECASSFGVICVDAERRIQAFQEKPRQPITLPDDPGRVYASMGNYLFEPRTLVELLEAAARRGATDFGRDIMPALPRACRALAYDFAGNDVPGIKPHEEPAYWRDVGTLESLAAARGDVLGPQPRFDLTNPLWPIQGDSTRGLLVKLREWNQRTGQIAARHAGVAKPHAGLRQEERPEQRG